MITRSLARMKNYFKMVKKILAPQNLRAVANKKRIVKIILSNVLSLVNSSIKILAPAAFGKGIEMVAKSKETQNVFGMELSSTNLFYLSAVFTTWTLLDGHLRRSLIWDTEQALVKNLSLQLVKKTHEITMSEHSLLKNEMIGGYFSIQNMCLQLPQEVINSFYPSIADIILGISFIWYQFGRTIGFEFLFYVLFDLFIYNNLMLACSQSDKHSKIQSLKLNEFIQHEFEMLAHVETVRMSDRQHYEMRESRRRMSTFLKARKKMLRSDFIYHILNKIPQFVATFVIVSRISAKDSIHGVDESIFLLTYFNLFAASVNHCNYSLKSLFDIMNAIEKINQILNKGSECHVGLTQVVVSERISDVKPASVEFCNVTFGYSRDNPILKDVSFFIAPGKKTAIVGKTGSGKSTIAKLLLKFHQPDSGVIKIDGVDIKDIPSSVLRSQIGYVNQSPEVFEKESLHYNLIYGVSGHPLPLREKKKKQHQPTHYHTFDSKTDRRTESKSSAMCASFMGQVGLKELAHRMDEPSGAAALSGGQKQQLVWARALAKNPRLLIGDEPTSALDSFTESHLLTCFSETTAEKTILMIAHRLSTIRGMNEIIVLDKGKIIEKGTHDELMNVKSAYFSYWELQSREIDNPGVKTTEISHTL